MIINKIFGESEHRGNREKQEIKLNRDVEVKNLGFVIQEDDIEEDVKHKIYCEFM